MSIAKAISNFLHRAKDDAAATEEELKTVLKAIEPEVVAIKNAIVDEVKDELPHIIEEVKTALTKEAAAIIDRFDAIEARLAMMRAENIQATSAVKKAAQNLKKQPATPAPEAAVVPESQTDEKSNTN